MVSKDAVRADIVIDASPAMVWRVLIDFDAYAEWNPFIIEASGAVREGGRFTATFRPAGSKGTRLKPRILRVDAPRELRWKGSVVMPGLFDGEHVFHLSATAEGGTYLRQEESFTGLLVPLFRRSLGSTQAAFVAMNEALRARVHHRTGANARPVHTTGDAGAATP